MPQFTNTANIFRSTGATTPLATATATFTTLDATSLEVTKVVDKPNEAYFKGDPIVFTVTLTNTSDVAINDLVFTDTIPNGVTYQTGNTFTVTTSSGTVVSAVNPIQVTGINIPAGNAVTITIIGQIA